MAAIDMATLENLHSEYSHWNADQVKVFFENKDVDLTSCGLPSEFSNGPVTGAYLDKLLVDLQKPTSEVPISVSQKIQGLIKSLQYQQYKIYNDPIHGSIEVHPLLDKIINTPEFHRLKDIKQLGGVHYVYPGAVHTRFEHSIGVCYIAGEFALCLQQKQPELKITDKDVLCVQIAGLCHDLGHGPFSHLFEDVVEKIQPDNYKKHDEISILVFEHMYKENKDLRKEFKRYGLDDDECKIIKGLMEGSETKMPKLEGKSFLYEIVANKRTGIDVDKWDYFARDCHYLGIPNDFEWRRCMLLSRVVKDSSSRELRICFRDKEAKNIYGMFRTRSNLHQRAYQHKTKCVVEHMIAEAILKAKNVELFHSQEQEGLKTIKGVVEMACQGDVEGYLQLTDHIIQQIKWAEVRSDQCQGKEDSKKDLKKDLKEAQELLKKVEHRDLFHCVEVHRTYQQEKPKDVEKTYLVALLGHSDATQNVVERRLNKFLRSKHITEKDVHVQIVRFRFGSEKSKEEKDPVKDVDFYDKDHPWEMEAKPQVSKLMMPEKFEEKEVRVYNKNKEDSQLDEKIKGAFKEWCSLYEDYKDPEHTDERPRSPGELGES